MAHVFFVLVTLFASFAIFGIGAWLLWRHRNLAYLFFLVFPKV